MIDRIKGAFTRKIGPAPAWVWLLLVVGVVYFYRKYRAGSIGTTSTSSTTPADAATPQDPLVVPAGDSVYDPNTGALSSAPGGAGSTDTTSADAANLDAAMNGLADALAQGITVTTDSGVTPGSTGSGGAGKRRGMSRLTNAQRRAGDVAAPSGPRRPHHPPRGYHTVGLGRGNWAFKKNASKRKPKTTRRHQGKQLVGTLKGKGGTVKKGKGKKKKK